MTRQKKKSNVYFTKITDLAISAYNRSDSSQILREKIYRRFIYPATEATLNGVNYQAAVGKISGGDTNDGKVWWDK